MLPFAILCGLVLAATATGFFALFRTKALIRAAGRVSAAAGSKLEAEVQAMRQTIEGLAAQVQDVQQLSRVAAAPAVPKPGLNLSKRSQALRMHRRGEAAGQIADALDIPLQEVDLLLKVHRIVMSSIG
jgi:DNA-binding NarL/FixJ family response regulator